MFDRFFDSPELGEEVAAKLGDLQVAPAVWQSYLQRQDQAVEAAANCNFSDLVADRLSK
jgi:hypothetical protein